MRILIVSDTDKQGSQIEKNLMATLYLSDIFNLTWQEKYRHKENSVEFVITCGRHPTSNGADVCILATQRVEAVKRVYKLFNSDNIVYISTVIDTEQFDICSAMYELFTKAMGYQFEWSEFESAFKRQVDLLDKDYISTYNQYGLGQLSFSK